MRPNDCGIGLKPIVGGPVPPVAPPVPANALLSAIDGTPLTSAIDGTILTGVY